MNESLILIVDYEKICRLCLHSTGAMSDIFENNAETSLKDLVLHATGLKVEQDDGLPSKICYKCRYIVELSCELRNMVAKTHFLLSDANPGDKECEEEVEKPIETLHAVTKTNTIEAYMKPDFNRESQEHEILTIEEDTEYIPNEAKCDNENSEDVNLSTSNTRRTAPKHLTCQICLRDFPNVEDVACHVNTHYVGSRLTPYLKMKKPFKCESCNRTMSKTQMVRHHRTHLNINPFECKHPGCDYVGKNNNHLRLHGRRHGARSVVCERCGLSFHRGWDLLQHTARAHRVAPTRCHICAKTFRNALTYEQHMRYYHREPRFACEWAGCSKAYRSRSSLAVHARSHSGEKLFKCHLCAAAAYTSQSLLNRHLRMHERARMSKCDKCAATFEDYSAFYRHRVTQHGPWLPYRCAGCHLGYQTEIKLQKHMQTCEKAIHIQSRNDSPHTEDNSKQLFVSSVEETPEMLQLAPELLDKLKGQSLLVQPGNMHELGKQLVLQELPPDGLLYIEVDEEIEEERPDSWQQ